MRKTKRAASLERTRNGAWVFRTASHEDDLTCMLCSRSTAIAMARRDGWIVPKDMVEWGCR